MRKREALPQDRNDQSYDDGTMRVVIAFREQFRLEPCEVVDEPMAEALNRALEDLGTIDVETQEFRHMAR